ncbi:MAG: hypothetical protein QOH19_1814, partial [Actinomycetota bacterium]|nr:hypothetical protein [Actinomycetota bacterium]
ANGAGLCEACNHTKETPGWAARPVTGPRHTLHLTTPTGHSYHSTAPPLPGTISPPQLAGPADEPDPLAGRRRRELRRRAKARKRPQLTGSSAA